MFLFTGKRKSRPGCPVVLPLPPPPEPPVEPTPPPTKILLLGTFESGKSTIRIQTRLLFGHVFSTKEKIKIKVFIIRNIIENMRQMLRATQTLHLDMSTEENRQRKEKILAMHPRVLLNPKDDIWNETLVQDLEELLKDPAILQVLARRNEFIIHDCATYFFDHLHRIANKDYVPSMKI
ncbi:hypothetical protein C9374_007788 [Naegleria lovaniensis]|uniref:Uncharacterized protein n=1 Tax=Naegleria lovaniensis TaxID=51637 RepID=A0AA88KH27_NAELO|nr:uncharacterized protein C9374_007788 [Naegleria lovaniensis]KAG2379150.1 hypothetical protein C9374_007788 [Naegleria lovaniensis]